jgi:hypothetical protein
MGSGLADEGGEDENVTNILFHAGTFGGIINQ